MWGEGADVSRARKHANTSAPESDYTAKHSYTPTDRSHDFFYLAHTHTHTHTRTHTHTYDHP